MSANHDDLDLNAELFNLVPDADADRSTAA